ncbi:MAG: hypothetical protein GY820_16390 [Gammaproteobacteria bacterium]|nr:hypothetical protein [Gammaproteobacteria bacterium]
MVHVIDGDTVKLQVNIWPGLIQVVDVGLDGVNLTDNLTDTRKKTGNCQIGSELLPYK